MTRYPRDLMTTPTPVNPLYPVPMPRDHDCAIRPEPPDDLTERVERLERDIAWLRKAIQESGGWHNR